MDKRVLIELLAIDWVCPLNHEPSTPYERGEVSKLIRFAEDVLLSFGYKELPEGKPPIVSPAVLNQAVRSVQFSPFEVILEAIASVQRDADIKWYEGEDK